jgi:GT2 family glycosyltransferase
MDETIIVLAWNGMRHISKCLSSICRQVKKRSEILLIDNGSSDGTARFVRSNFSSVRVVENACNLGVSNGWNIGVKLSNGKLIHFINQDVYLRDGFLDQMRNMMNNNKNIGVAGGKLLYPGGVIIQHAGGQIELPQFLTTHRGLGESDIGLYESEMEMDYVTGAAFCIRTEVFERIGNFDPIFSPAYCEDLDFCIRARLAGFGVMYNPQAVAIHYHSSSLGMQSYSKYYYKHTNRLRLVYKHLHEKQLSSFFKSEIRWILSSMFSKNEILALSNIYPDYFHSKPEHKKKWLQKLFLIHLSRYRALELGNLR